MHKVQEVKKLTMTSFRKQHKNKLLQSGEKAQLVPQTKRLQAVCDSLLFVSVYSGPSILMDWPVTDLGMHIPPGL